MQAFVSKISSRLVMGSSPLPALHCADGRPAAHQRRAAIKVISRPGGPLLHVRKRGALIAVRGGLNLTRSAQLRVGGGNLRKPLPHELLDKIGA